MVSSKAERLGFLEPMRYHEGPSGHEQARGVSWRYTKFT